MIIHDVNNNGVYDAADVVIQPTISRVSLLAKSNMSLLVECSITRKSLEQIVVFANIKVTEFGS